MRPEIQHKTPSAGRHLRPAGGSAAWRRPSSASVRVPDCVVMPAERCCAGVVIMTEMLNGCDVRPLRRAKRTTLSLCRLQRVERRSGGVLGYFVDC